MEVAVIAVVGGLCALSYLIGFTRGYNAAGRYCVERVREWHRKVYP